MSIITLETDGNILEGEINDLTGTASLIAELKAYKELVDRFGEGYAKQDILPYLQKQGITMEEFETTLKVSGIAHNNPLGARHSLKIEELIEEHEDKICDEGFITRFGDDN